MNRTEPTSLPFPEQHSLPKHRDAGPAAVCSSCRLRPPPSSAPGQVQQRAQTSVLDQTPRGVHTQAHSHAHTCTPTHQLSHMCTLTRLTHVHTHTSTLVHTWTLAHHVVHQLMHRSVHKHTHINSYTNSHTEAHTHTSLWESDLLKVDTKCSGRSKTFKAPRKGFPLQPPNTPTLNGVWRS